MINQTEKHKPTELLQWTTQCWLSLFCWSILRKGINSGHFLSLLEVPKEYLVWMVFLLKLLSQENQVPHTFITRIHIDRFDGGTVLYAVAWTRAKWDRFARFTTSCSSGQEQKDKSLDPCYAQTCGFLLLLRWHLFFLNCLGRVVHLYASEISYDCREM